jgi:hypothetical protein
MRFADSNITRRGGTDTLLADTTSMIQDARQCRRERLFRRIPAGLTGCAAGRSA